MRWNYFIQMRKENENTQRWKLYFEAIYTVSLWKYTRDKWKSEDDTEFDWQAKHTKNENNKSNIFIHCLLFNFLVVGHFITIVFFIVEMWHSFDKFEKQQKKKIMRKRKQKNAQKYFNEMNSLLMANDREMTMRRKALMYIYTYTNIRIFSIFKGHVIFSNTFMRLLFAQWHCVSFLFVKWKRNLPFFCLIFHLYSSNIKQYTHNSGELC